MCEKCERQEARDRAMWVAIRRGLMAIASAIEKRYNDDITSNHKGGHHGHENLQEMQGRKAS